MQSKRNLSKYFSSFWNWIEFLGLLLFYVGLILRFVPNNNDIFVVAKYIQIREK